MTPFNKITGNTEINEGISTTYSGIINGKNFFKIILATFFCIFLLQTSVNAQDTPVRFGIKGGVNFTNINTNDADENKMRTGFNVGLFLKFPITSYIAIQPELYYTTKGSEVSYNNTFVNGTAGFHLNYIELPLMIVGNITENFNVHAGPYVAYLLSGKVKNESNIDLFNFEDNLNTDDFNTLETGLAVGAGIDINAVSIRLRYIQGLTKVGKERTFLGNNYTVPDGKNSVINLYISLSLN